MRYHITITIRIFVSRPVTIRPCPKTAGTTPTSVSLAGISQFHRIAITVHLNPSAGVVGRNRFSLLSRGQQIKYSSPRRFRTAHGEGPFLSVELWSHTSGAAWRVRPSGPDSGLVQPAAYVLPTARRTHRREIGRERERRRRGSLHYTPTPIL